MRISRTVLTGDRSVSEQTEVALAVSAAVADDVAAFLDGVKRLYLAAIAAAVVGVLLGGFLLVQGPTMVGAAVLVLGLLGGGGAYYYADSQEPDVTVKQVEKRYWTAHVFPRETGSIVYDATDATPHSEFVLEELRNPDVLSEAHSTLSERRDLPVVMDRDDNVEVEYRRTLEDVSAELSSTETTEVDAPVLDDDDAVVQSLKRMESHVESGDAGVSSIEIPMERAEEDVRVVEELEELVAADDSEDTLQRLKRDSGEAVEELFDAQAEAVRLMNDHIETAGEVLALSTYNFYCPDCMEDDVEARLDVEYGDELSWFCTTCQTRFSEDVVVPKHAMRDTLVEDVWDRLWIEKDDERRRIYERIEKEKRELKENEFQERREEIRTAWNRIKDVRSKLRDLRTQAKAGEGAIDEIGDLMVEYEHLSQQRKQQFHRDVDQAIERIDQETEELLQETENMEQEKIEQAEKEAERKAQLEKAEERRRHQDKMAALEANAKANVANAKMNKAVHDQIKAHNDLKKQELSAKYGGR